MGDLSGSFVELPPEQQAIRAKCFHPSGVFIEFRKEEIEQSIPDRFEQQVAKYPNRIAIKTGNHTLTGFWAEALGLDQVGIHDNFFELGGNSLLAAQVISRINGAFNVNLSPQSLYETPTVAELAITVMQGQAA